MRAAAPLEPKAEVLSVPSRHVAAATQLWYHVICRFSTGPFNQHFVRDIGFTFIPVGAAYLVGAVRQNSRTLLWGTAASWLAAHALFHA